MMRSVIRVILLLCLGSAVSAAYAHHSFQATFASDAKISVEGIVTKFSFRNPHINVYLDVTNDDGTVTNWMSEGAAATLMRRAGWNKTTVMPGDRIRVHGDSTHDGSPMVSIDSIDVLDPDGKAVLQTLRRQQGAYNDPPKKAAAMPLSLPDGRPNLTGAWTNHGMRSGRPGPPTLKFNQTGEALQASYDKANDPQIFCDPPGLVRQLNTPHPIRITQFDDHVVIEYEEFAGTRDIPVSSARKSGAVRSHFGESYARYVDQTLVIATKNLTANPSSPEGHQLSDQTTTLETYSRMDSQEYGPVLMINVEISDPEYLVGTGSIAREKMSAGEYEFIENDCRAPLRERGATQSGVE